MDRGELLLADVAVLRHDRFGRVVLALCIGGCPRGAVAKQIHVGRREHRLAAQFANAGFLQHAVVATGRIELPLLGRGLHHGATGARIRVKHVSDRVEEALTLLERDVHQPRTIGDHLLQQRGSGAEVVAERVGGMAGFDGCIVGCSHRITMPKDIKGAQRPRGISPSDRRRSGQAPAAAVAGCRGRPARRSTAAAAAQTRDRQRPAQRAWHMNAT